MKIRMLLLCATLVVGACSTPKPLSSYSEARLENTYWKLVMLDDTAVSTPEGAREIQFVLNSEEHRVSGFSGCNRMTGTYKLENEKLAFGNMAGTRMACADTMELELRVNQMFANVAFWKISGETLTLIDARGKAIATFESRYMK